MNPPIGAIDEDLAGAVVVTVGPHATPHDGRPHTVAQHFLVPGVAAVAQDEGRMDRDAGAGKYVITNGVVSVFPPEGEIKRPLSVHPVVFATHAVAAMDTKSPLSAGGKKFE